MAIKNLLNKKTAFSGGKCSSEGLFILLLSQCYYFNCVAKVNIASSSQVPEPRSNIPFSPKTS